MNFENFNFNFENVDVQQALAMAQRVLEDGFDCEEAREFRAGLQAACPEITPEQASLVLPWVEALASHLRSVAAPATKVATPAPKVAAPAPKVAAPAPRPTAKDLEDFFFLGM